MLTYYSYKFLLFYIIEIYFFIFVKINIDTNKN